MITTHVLDTALGKPGFNIPVTLAERRGEDWVEVGRGATDADGRIKTLGAGDALRKGTYRLSFEVGEYLAKAHRGGFYDTIPIVFRIDHPEQHFHVPLLLNPFGYSTYRGS